MTTVHTLLLILVSLFLILQYHLNLADLLFPLPTSENAEETMNSNSPIQLNPEAIPLQRMNQQNNDGILIVTGSGSDILTSTDSSNMNEGRIVVAS